MRRFICCICTLLFFTTLQSFSVNAAETFICKPYKKFEIETEQEKYKRGSFISTDTVVLIVSDDKLTSVTWSGNKITWGKATSFKETMNCDTEHLEARNRLECWENLKSKSTIYRSKLAYNIFRVENHLYPDNDVLSFIRKGQKSTDGDEAYIPLIWEYEFFFFDEKDGKKSFSSGGYDLRSNSIEKIAGYICN